jgi:ATP-dependent exoDNAse (exonuclease V) alpha subunit
LPRISIVVVEYFDKALFIFVEREKWIWVIYSSKDLYNMDYSPSQLNAINTIVSLVYAIIYLIGPGGYGKTASVREAIRQLKENNPGIRISIVATTTIAAEVLGTICGIRTTTFHKWWQMGPKSLRMRDEKFMKETLATLSPINPRETDVLFLDEGSMLTIQVLEVMDRLLRWYRGNQNQRFGGMKIIVIGDPLQLQPVPNDAGPGLLRDEHLESTSCLTIFDGWSSEYCVLRHPQRCKDQSFQAMLQKLMLVNPTMRQEAMVAFDIHYQPGLDTFPRIVKKAKEYDAIIISHNNKNVDRFNQEVQDQLRRKGKKSYTLSRPERLFTEADVVSIPNVDGVDPADQLDREEQAITIDRKRYYMDKSIYEGQIVQIRATHDCISGEELTVGELCTFMSLNEDGNTVLVRKSDGKEVIVGKHEACSEFWTEMKWTGYPFIASDASTVHLVQGCTIHGKVIFYSNIVGTIYGDLPFYLNVAASRVTDPNNFIITHKMGQYALQADEITKKLKPIWDLDFMKQYPVNS